MTYAAAAANAAIMVGYLAISYRILRGLVITRQIRTNRLGLATASIFLSCGLGHGIHFEHLLPSLLDGRPDTVGQAVDWHLVAADLVTALIAFWHWSLRKQYGAMLEAGQLYEDVKGRQRQALEINDNIVQGLTVAHLALASKDANRSLEAMEATLAKARTIISDLIGEVGEETRLTPGELVRTRPAVVVADGGSTAGGTTGQR